jgi:hypothetical protein
MTFLVGYLAIAGTWYALHLEAKLRLRTLTTDDPHAHETFFVEISVDGVRGWCAHIDVRHPWSDFANVTENTEFYLFTRPNGSGSFIPKRLLDDVADAELRDRIREWSPDHGSGLARAVPS